MRRADDLMLPMLMLHGLADRVVPPDGTIALHALAGSRDKTLKTYPQAWHHLLLDDVRDAVTRDIVAWLEARRLTRLSAARSRRRRDRPPRA